MSEYLQRNAESKDSNDSYTFVTPKKSIFTTKDLNEFKKSKTFDEIRDFVVFCAEKVKGCKISDGYKTESSGSSKSDENDDIQSANVDKIERFMCKMCVNVDEIPPIQQPMRFGNKAFRLWHNQLTTEVSTFLRDLLPGELVKAGGVNELSPYVCASFGDETRIDYGTGHEMNIIVFFLCLYKLSVIKTNEIKALILKGFSAYIKTMRKLQTVYFLEPAGSHGVWGLDDYHCLAFLFGAAQLCNNSEMIMPNSIHISSVLDQYKDEYLYLECIAFIKSIKNTAPFAETSPMLNDVSALEDWAKVCGGLIKLFQGEVMCKVPVVQHLYFGSLIKCVWEPDIEASNSTVYKQVMAGIATVRPN